MVTQRDLAAEIASPKYAHIEFERRWRVNTAARPDLSSARESTLIEDRYIEGARMRLRRMSQPTIGWSSLKLTKKYHAEDASARPIVTAYLTEAEFELLAALPARTIVKRRYSIPYDGREWSLDSFEGPLTGLEILEIEARDSAELAALAPPHWALQEVTYDPDYQCGTLAFKNRIPEV